MVSWKTQKVERKRLGHTKVCDNAKNVCHSWECRKTLPPPPTGIVTSEAKLAGSSVLSISGQNEDLYHYLLNLKIVV